MTLVVSAVGFYRQVYFISLGYGLSVAALGVAMLILYRDLASTVNLLQPLLLVIYGLRLSGYLLFREVTVESFKVKSKEGAMGGKSSGLAAAIPMWISVALMYFALTSPVYFRLQAGGERNTLTLIGLAVMAIGIAMEAAADWTKYTHKKKNPNSFCSNGLFSLVRYPNYLGEILTWTGVFLSAIGYYQGILQWLIAIAGFGAIFFVMMSAARDLEARQNKRYGGNVKYQKYIKNTPILFPFIKLYTLRDARIFKM